MTRAAYDGDRYGAQAQRRTNPTSGAKLSPTFMHYDGTITAFGFTGARVLIRQAVVGRAQHSDQRRDAAGR